MKHSALCYDDNNSYKYVLRFPNRNPLPGIPCEGWE